MASARSEHGFGLVELLVAMTVLSVGLLAVVAAFSSGSIAIDRASHVATAATLADAQMETYRAMVYGDIGVDTSAGTLAALDAAYRGDAACYDPSLYPGLPDCTQLAAVPPPPPQTALVAPTSDGCATIDAWYPTSPCTPSRVVTGPDHHDYRIDTYVALLPAQTSGLELRARKQVTVVVRDGAGAGSVLARESSLFDCSTGTPPGAPPC